MDLSLKTVTLEARDGVLLMGLNRARKRNAFNLEMLGELAAAYGAYEADSELRCAVLFAHGNHFTGGLDLAEVGPAVARGALLFPAGSIEPLDMLEPRRTKPIVCGIQGYCLTIGVELLLASDVRIAAHGCRIAQMEVKRGIMPFGGATLRFPQICGWGNAMRYLLTGDELGAEEALRIGLVQEVVAEEMLLDRACELAQTIAHQAPLAVKQTRLSARIAIEQGSDAAKAALMGQARELMESEDAREGMLSFLQRRPAQFKGR